MVLIGVLVGLCVFAVYLVMIKLLFKASEINPLLHLAFVYLLYQLSSGMMTILPESWTVKQFDTPVMIEGTVGFFLRLNNPQMSVHDIIISILFLCFSLFFIYQMGVKWYLKRKKPKENTPT